MHYEVTTQDNNYNETVRGKFECFSDALTAYSRYVERIENGWSPLSIDSTHIWRVNEFGYKLVNSFYSFMK